MEKQVIGSGFMFLASGCGPVLTSEQRTKLTAIKPDVYYPLDELLSILEEAKKKDPSIVYTTGKRWGGALKAMWDEKGITDIQEAQIALCSVYQEHHDGDVGELSVEKVDEDTIILVNGGPYPTELIAGAYEAVAGTMGGGETSLERLEENKYRISWGGN